VVLDHFLCLFLNVSCLYLLAQVGISESGIDDAVKNLVARG
jgi:hypothetical protein